MRNFPSMTARQFSVWIQQQVKKVTEPDPDPVTNNVLANDDDTSLVLTDEDETSAYMI